jgi:hypothetical protein
MQKFVILAIVAAVLALLAPVHADSPAVQTLQVQVGQLSQFLSSLSAQLKLAVWEAEVRQAQATYNFHLDRLFDIACLNFSVPANAAALDDHLNLLMDSFCPDFTTWTAAVPGFANGSVTKVSSAPANAMGYAATRATYKAITQSGTFGCGSQHNVMNPVITFDSDDQGRPLATLTGRLWQFAIFGSGSWSDIMGWYDNDWTLENGQWCMSRFFAANDIIVVRGIPTAVPYNVGGPVPEDSNIFQFAAGTDQLPPLPRVIPDYVA